ncbi:MAG: NusA N-terminal domain-containing protein, partial [Candidatus Nanopelagicaceae bacterium]
MKALQVLTTEKEISLSALIVAIEAAVLAAYNHTDHALEHARAHLDRESG